MKFSIIVPVYNIEQYIEECIESVICQTFSEYELLLIDDGSTDRSGAIIDEYAKNYDYMKIIHKENTGPSDTRNIGILQAIGEYILFLDGDDYWLENDFLEKLNDFINTQERTVDIVAFNALPFYVSDGKKVFDSKRGVILEEKKQCENSEQVLIEILSTHFFLWSPWQYAIRKSLFDKKDLKFPVGRFYEDLYIMWRILISAKTIGIMGKQYYGYRNKRVGSTINTVSYRNMNDKLWAAEENIKDTENLIKNKTLQKLLKDNFAKYCTSCFVQYIDLPKNEKKSAYRLLKEKKGLMRYAVCSETGRKHFVICKVIGFTGLRIFTALLWVWSRRKIFIVDKNRKDNRYANRNSND